MISNYYNEIRLKGYDKELITKDEFLNIILNHNVGYDVEFTQQNNCTGRLILKKNGKRFKKLRIVETKGKSPSLKGDDVYVEFWSSPKSEPNFKFSGRSTHAAKAIKSLYELIPVIEQYNQDILKEYNAA
ncbi:hypothetical protein [Pseudomonas sp.]|uniref:hypothetical protein n=1 Tax=Pseudomonas sp. TaxID=306 RepID=UPI0025878C8A|nr:hypothetical protein [Pseudomonas sp.]